VKTVSQDKTYIDYTSERVGVRVRRNVCRPIIFQRGRWVEYGVSYSIPVEPRQLQAQRTGISSLASNLSQVNDSELRGLVAGETNFEDAAEPVGRAPGTFVPENCYTHPA
jgi:hypothetical protein